AIRQEAIGRLELEPVHTVVLMFMGADIRAQCRYVARRIRRMDPEVRIAVVLLNAAAGEETADLLHVDALYRDLDKAADAIKAAHAPDKHRRAVEAQHSAGLGRGDDALRNDLDASADAFDDPGARINHTVDERHPDDE